MRKDKNSSESGNNGERLLMLFLHSLLIVPLPFTVLCSDRFYVVYLFCFYAYFE